MTKEEIWKPIVDYEGIYEVSNTGKIRSLDRISCIGRNLKGQILNPSIDAQGYFMVRLSKNGKVINGKIHQIVAITFLDHKRNGYNLVINHKDFNKLNNNLDNLEIVTQRENSNRKHLKSSSKYTGVSWDKYNKKWVTKIRINGKQHQLGYFINEDEAYLAYKNALAAL